MDISLELLRKIYWYKPKSFQTIYVAPHIVEEIYRVNLHDKDCPYLAISGIPVEITTNYDELVQVQLSFPRNDDLICPEIPLKLLQYKTIGVVGYSLHHMSTEKKGAKVDMYKQLITLSKELIKKYNPSKVITSATWGLDLAFAHCASTDGIEVELAVPKRSQESQYYWDKTSKLMIGELLTEKKVPTVNLDTSSLSKTHVINNCDVCIMQIWHKSSRNKLIYKSARASNIPIIEVRAWL